MLKKAMAAAAVAASVVGAASPAMAIGNDEGTTSASGNGAHHAFANSVTKGDMSPQATLVQSSLNKLCIGLPAKANLQGLVGVAAVGVLQDVPVLSAPQNQQCAENSTQAKGDEPLSHILSDIAALSGNGVKNG
ncbi:RdlB protein [Streptomyces lincolnensis]|uniref:RdlB protein n=1 Tax=Streptomyces lincolnensis TaxID=1915 RepID=A0A1B1M9Q0_STRLN|nr:rodlin [Streptomyces lincolnensis]ANS65360.1 RdlB protein [Streptomyces lincolnensis]AXG56432.1 RdlB protein [Streptomyces lincolnensis]QMV07125.1 RdlA protein [Streptomyces lincolnensis]